MGYNDNYIKISIVKTASDCIAFYTIGARKDVQIQFDFSNY
jgi:hypothetical protein